MTDGVLLSALTKLRASSARLRTLAGALGQAGARDPDTDQQPTLLDSGALVFVDPDGAHANNPSDEMSSGMGSGSFSPPDVLPRASSHQPDASSSPTLVPTQAADDTMEQEYAPGALGVEGAAAHVEPPPSSGSGLSSPNAGGAPARAFRLHAPVFHAPPAPPGSLDPIDSPTQINNAAAGLDASAPELAASVDAAPRPHEHPPEVPTDVSDVVSSAFERPEEQPEEQPAPEGAAVEGPEPVHLAESSDEFAQMMSALQDDLQVEAPATLVDNDSFHALDISSPAPPIASADLMGRTLPSAAPKDLSQRGPTLFRVRQGRATAATPATRIKIQTLASTDSTGDEIVDDIQSEIVPLVVEEIEELIPEISTLLDQMASGDTTVTAELHRKVHTFKGTVGQVGARRARAVVHKMETAMEAIDEGRVDPTHADADLRQYWAAAQALVQPLRDGSWAQSVVAPDSTGSPASHPAPQIAVPRSVRVATPIIDEMIASVDESRLTGRTLDVMLKSMRTRLREFDENAQRVARLQRDLELQAEIQMQSHRVQFGDAPDGFDPLEFDRFTHLQELTRLVGEGVADLMEVRRDIGRALADGEGVLAHQRQSITSAAALLHHTRLTPADAINDRLHNVLWSTAKEIGKEADFEMAGGRIELDRVLLEKMIGPLEHILRNAVAHGIETADERLKRGKRQRGVVSVRVRQDAARVTITVEDDGAGIPVDVVRRKAVQRGLWPDQAPMSADQAAEMICTPGFSTAAVVSEHAGRGVGMDVVRSEILALGGRFQVTSTEGVGTIITLQLPASVAQASVLVVEAAGCSWALPIEMVDDVQASQDTLDGIAQEPLKVVPLAALVSPDRPAGAPRRRVVCRDRGRTMVLAVDRLVHVAAVPVHALGILWASQPGLAGTVVLPDGRALFLLDPFRLADAHHTLPSLGRIPSAVVDTDQPGADQPGAVDQPDGSTPSHGSPGLSVTPSGRPMVLVVDDSLTVRKAAKRLLEANGYEITTAKDGQDALDLLRSIRPAVILMDIEMPRMNGLECVRVVRSTPALADLPIIMITSRTGDKHRSRALEMNVQAYLGKPFRDKEVLSALKSFAGTRVSDPTDP